MNTTKPDVRANLKLKGPSKTVPNVVPKTLPMPQPSPHDNNFALDLSIYDNGLKVIANDDHLPWVEKYRPKDLFQISTDNYSVEALRKFLKAKDFPHLLLYGPSGTGKTSSIMVCVKALYGENALLNVLEINASDGRRIDVVRKTIKKFATHSILKVSEADIYFKLVILDEVDAMTSEAQAILKKIIEDNCRTVRFCLVCNYLYKIMPALQSRCVLLRFPALTNTVIVTRLREICDIEEILINNGALDCIVKVATGDMRKSINVLQSVSILTNEITENDINRFTGQATLTELEELSVVLNERSFSECWDHIYEMIHIKCYNIIDIIMHFYERIEYDLVNGINVENQEYSCNLVLELQHALLSVFATTNSKLQASAFVSAFKILS